MQMRAIKPCTNGRTNRQRRTPTERHEVNQLFVELYNYKDAWRETSSEQRHQFVEGVMQSIGTLADSGIEILGCAHNDLATDRRAPYDFFCVYRVADQQAQKTFFDEIERSGWYDRFDQVNLSGPALNPPGLLFDNGRPGLSGPAGCADRLRHALR